MVMEVVDDESDEGREIVGARARASVLWGIPFVLSSVEDDGGEHGGGLPHCIAS